MTKLLGCLTAMGVTALGILWFYGVIYSWLWVGLTHSTAIGATVGYSIMFILFVPLSIVVVGIICFLYMFAMDVYEE